MSKVKFKWKCGDVLRDKVTGLVGVVMVRAEYATGCHHYGLQAQKLTGEGKTPNWEWLDQSRLVEEHGAKPVKFDIPTTGTSGAFPSGPKA